MTKNDTMDALLAEMRDVPEFVGWTRKAIVDTADRIEAAYKRELAAAYDPRRLRGTAKADSFDAAIDALREYRWQHATNDTEAIPYINAVEDAHRRELAAERGLADVDWTLAHCPACEARLSRLDADMLGHCPKTDGTCPDGDVTCPNGEERQGDEPGHDHILGAAGANGMEALAGQPAQVTAELREYVKDNRMSNGMGVETMWGNSVPYDLLAIADRIDEAHVDECVGVHDAMEAECNRLCDERDALLDLLRDARDEYVGLRKDIRRGCDSENELLSVIASVMAERDELARQLDAATVDARPEWVTELRDKLADLRDACSMAVDVCEEATRDEAS